MQLQPARRFLNPITRAQRGCALNTYEGHAPTVLSPVRRAAVSRPTAVKNSPFGLPKLAEDPRREQRHFGVYSMRAGKVRLVSTDFTGPNGLAFSPDEKFLYVGNWDETRKVP